MHGLSHKDARVFFSEGKKERAFFSHEGNEIFISRPRAVEEDVVAEGTDLFHDQFRVGEDAVVGAELKAGQTEGTFLFFLSRSGLPHKGPQIFLVQRLRGNAADHAFLIPHGIQPHGNGPALGERPLVDGFVVVPVEEDEVARREERGAADPVRRGGAVQHEVRPVRMPDFRGEGLRFPAGPFVGRGVADGAVRVGQIHVKDPFAEKRAEKTPSRSLPEERAAVVAGGSEIPRPPFRPRRQGRRERRQQAPLVSLRRFLRRLRQIEGVRLAADDGLPFPGEAKPFAETRDDDRTVLSFRFLLGEELPPRQFPEPGPRRFRNDGRQFLHSGLPFFSWTLIFNH